MNCKLMNADPLGTLANRRDIVMAFGERVQLVRDRLQSRGYLGAIAGLVVASM